MRLINIRGFIQRWGALTFPSPQQEFPPPPPPSFRNISYVVLWCEHNAGMKRDGNIELAHVERVGNMATSAGS